jgi:hypothetical protein
LSGWRRKLGENSVSEVFRDSRLVPNTGRLTKIKEQFRRSSFGVSLKSWHVVQRVILGLKHDVVLGRMMVVLRFMLLILQLLQRYAGMMVRVIAAMVCLLDLIVEWRREELKWLLLVEMFVWHCAGYEDICES